MPTVTVEQAAMNALAAWLQAGLGADVKVSPQWFDADRGLPAKAISLVFAGAREDTLTDAELDGERVIHANISARVAAGQATDLSSALTLLNVCKASYEAHRVDTSAHQAADTTHAIAAPNAVDLASGIALATEMLGDLAAHFADTTAHATADTRNAPAQTAPTDLGTLISSAEAIRRALDRHYVARVYIWRIRACEQPVQLDVWAAYEATRDELLASLEPLLNASPADSAGLGRADPARNGVIVALGDGWTGYADFDFDEPRRQQSPGQQVRSEHRATYRGLSTFWLRIEAQSARLARITVRQLINGAAAATTTATWSSTGEPTITQT